MRTAVGLLLLLLVAAIATPKHIAGTQHAQQARQHGSASVRVASRQAASGTQHAQRAQHQQQQQGSAGVADALLPGWYADALQQHPELAKQLDAVAMQSQDAKPMQVQGAMQLPGSAVRAAQQPQQQPLQQQGQQQRRPLRVQPGSRRLSQSQLCMVTRDDILGPYFLPGAPSRSQDYCFPAPNSPDRPWAPLNVTINLFDGCTGLPLNNATGEVQVWQADNTGNYDNSRTRGGDCRMCGCRAAVAVTSWKLYHWSRNATGHTSHTHHTGHTGTGHTLHTNHTNRTHFANCTNHTYASTANHTYCVNSTNSTTRHAYPANTTIANSTNCATYHSYGNDTDSNATRAGNATGHTVHTGSGHTDHAGFVISRQFGFKYSTIMPSPYGSPGCLRPAHIHHTFHVTGYQTLTTQMYFVGDSYLGPNDCGCGDYCHSGDGSLQVNLTSKGTATWNVFLLPLPAPSNPSPPLPSL